MSGWRTKLKDAFESIRDYFSRLLKDFFESSQLFKMKVSIVSGYLGVSFLTLLIFCPRGETNDIDALVKLGRTEIVGGRYFSVDNQSSNTWRDVQLVFNRMYELRVPSLAAGKKESFYFKKFKDAAGKAPSEDVLVKHLLIRCSEGDFEHSFANESSK